MLRTILFFLFAFSTQLIQAQSEEGLQGKIYNEGHPVEKVNIVNETTGKSTVSDAQGQFNIAAKKDDILILSAINLETKRIIVNQSHLDQKELSVKMNTSILPLEEVKVNENSGVNAENLGIIPRGQKKYTPAERRLREATTGSGIVPLNPILNGISGRTKMLKKELRVEKKERLLLQLDGWFEDDFYENTLKISKQYVRGFHYFLIEDTDFVRALKAKNKTLTKFLAKGLGLKYNDILAVEQK
ncbi:carboxypeptidase-like regulatory domain-containing protein [Flavobacterium sp. CYK-4]|uniref:carboxypeptidase-like regulatory domain-containing protein n=1 Tax=Flavobacterium lotistagni TaxID=2709660 RepID=UPI00140C9538|nr:carboxypeptidase-like regulatory domain-containing protein [Flavobacterium lotistagni]NHM05781.1 carboxypeptidase-like regulatory domain-containing protein [Flavobacterium lotistagni]